MKYYLAQACQNTFVLFDCLDRNDLDDAFIQYAHQCLTKEQRDDALILLDGQAGENTFSAQMIVLGLNGDFGEFCGNGARSAAAYLFTHYAPYQTLSLRTEKHHFPLHKHGNGNFSIQLPSVFVPNRKFIATTPLQYIEVLEPHLVIEKPMSDEELFSMGRELNAQTARFPLGINVNAWHVLEEERIAVKTYERGVQRLTRSCGTGAIACAAAYRNEGFVQVETPGGPLQIVFEPETTSLYGEGKYA